MISDTIKYVKCCFKIIKPQHKDVDDVILKSALVYQYMHLNHCDAFGRFYANNSLDRGYTYVIPENKTPRWIKTSPLCGQVSGLIYCLWKRIIM